MPGNLTLEDEAARLIVRAEVAGILLLARPDDLTGKFFKRGEVLGHIDTAEAPRVRLVLPQWQSAHSCVSSPAARWMMANRR